ncbi:Prolipoprotein diacylglyceryl transferase [Aquisphaera giovannonii]|uniref:Phosphatidylglycerol--prolipoprotein diacylglyceryl transferase n=1 Tax=Aquisphaera giovannonii TaxID=406548 RepID=A0A5B9W7A9_9BACT|nr:prolipoprotein diacylglyceryl transferase [Aquisphaera giovannonii]QEH36458.1 Prolipoprotein diacylglyceryl transferase [Aquisphaera giovannonii]
MHPILFEMPAFGLKVHAYGVMILLACTGALSISAWRAGREGLRVNSVYELAAWLFTGGFIGARLLFIAQHPELVHSAADIVRSWQGGNVFYGCIMGGLVGTLIYWKRHPFPFLPMADAVAPGLAVGVMFGRIGCFLAGCCHGAVCGASWGIRFPAGSHAWMAHLDQGDLAPAAAWSLPVHPTQLYGALAGLLILAYLTWFFPRRRRDGEVMFWMMVLYAVTRWPIESLRGDDDALIAGMTISQIISIGLLALAGMLWVRLRRTPPGRLADGARGTMAAPAAAPAQPSRRGLRPSARFFS